MLQRLLHFEQGWGDLLSVKVLDLAFEPVLPRGRFELHGHGGERGAKAPQRLLKLAAHVEQVVHLAAGVQPVLQPGEQRVLARRKTSPAPAQPARLRVYLDALGASPDELAGLDLDALVERATARS